MALHSRRRSLKTPNISRVSTEAARQGPITYWCQISVSLHELSEVNAYHLILSLDVPTAVCNVRVPIMPNNSPPDSGTARELSISLVTTSLRSNHQLACVLSHRE